MSYHILFLDKAHPLLEQKLIALGCTCETDTTSTKEQIMAKMPDFQGIVLRSRLTLDADFLDSCTDLRFIAREGVGLEHIATDYAKAKGIKVLISPEGSRDTVAEHAIGLLLMLLNRLGRANEQVKNGVWERESNRGVELMGMTVGIIGYGNMGMAFAKRLTGFGVRVLAYDKFKTGYGDPFASEVGLAEIQEHADVVSLHIPFMAGNHHFLDDHFIQGFRKNIFVVNTARGLVLNTADLVKNLRSGKVRGAALDVIEYEDQSFDKFQLDRLPDDFRYLQKADNVVLSPHIAGWSFESKRKHAEVLAEKIAGLMDGWIA